MQGARGPVRPRACHRPKQRGTWEAWAGAYAARGRRAAPAQDGRQAAAAAPARRRAAVRAHVVEAPHGSRRGAGSLHGGGGRGVGGEHQVAGISTCLMVCTTAEPAPRLYYVTLV